MRRGRTFCARRGSVLRARGSALTTNRDIALIAGITPAAIYQYFDSKVALYVTAALEAVAEVAAHMRTRAAVKTAAGLWR